MLTCVRALSILSILSIMSINEMLKSDKCNLEK